MKPAGFALLELLVASVVVSAAGALLVGGLVQANRSAGLRVERMISTELLASELALLDGPVDPQQPSGGPCAPPLNDCAWTLRWTPAPLVPLAEATLAVERKSGTVHVVTYRPIAEP